MKEKLIYFILIGMVVSVRAQGLKGCWGNSFGSRMEIVEHNVETGDFKGKYGSHTGSSGVYELYGKTTPGATTDKNFAVSFAISWSTVSGAAFPDASAHWTGVMTGYYRASDQSLQLLNVISAPTQFTAVHISKGIYPQSLVFTQMSSEECNFQLEDDPDLADVRDALIGTWSSYITPNIGNIQITQVIPEKNRFLIIQGEMTSPDGDVLSITGLTSYLTEENSLSLSLVVNDEIDGTNYNLTVSGYLENGKMRLFETETRAPESTELSLVSNSISYDLYVKQ